MNPTTNTDSDMIGPIMRVLRQLSPWRRWSGSWQRGKASVFGEYEIPPNSSIQ